MIKYLTILLTLCKLTLWMSTWSFVFLRFVSWSSPLTSNDEVFAFCWTLFTLIALMMIQRWSWKFLVAKLLHLNRKKIKLDNVHDHQNLPDNRLAIHWLPSPLLNCVTRCSSRFRHDSLDKSRPDHAIDRPLTSAWNSQNTWDDPWRTKSHINEMKENKK